MEKHAYLTIFLLLLFHFRGDIPAPLDKLLNTSLLEKLIFINLFPGEIFIFSYKILQCRFAKIYWYLIINMLLI